MARQRTLIETALAVQRGEIKAKDLPESTRKKVERVLPSLGEAAKPAKPLAPVPFGSRTATRRARSA